MYSDIPNVNHSGDRTEQNDILFAISDMIKGKRACDHFFVHWNKFGQLLPGASDERRRLTDDVDESLTSKFDEMDKRMSDSNLRPLKLSVKMETNDWG